MPQHADECECPCAPPRGTQPSLGINAVHVQRTSSSRARSWATRWVVVRSTSNGVADALQRSRPGLALAIEATGVG